MRPVIELRNYESRKSAVGASTNRLSQNVYIRRYMWHRSKRNICLILLYLFVHILSPGLAATVQDSTDGSKPWDLSGWFYHGYLLPHHQLMTYFNEDNINGFEVVASRYYTGLNPVRPLEAGLGYYFSNLGNREVYGHVHGMYAVLGAEIFKDRSPVYIHQSVSVGLSYNTERFDIENNYFNRVIGSHINAFVILSMNLRADFGPVSLSAGPSMVHMSNGNMRQPNLGINLVNGRVGMTYRFGDGSSLIARELQVDTAFSRHRLQFFLSGGIRQLSRKIPNYYGVGSLVGEYSLRFTQNQALGFGLDLVYDATEGRETFITRISEEEVPPWHMAVHLSFERIYGRLSILVQPGYKIWTPDGHNYFQFNRAALRYRVEDNLMLNLSIKAHGLKGDFIEFGVGYGFER